MKNYLIKNALIINEGKQHHGDVMISNGRIERIDANIETPSNYQEINAEGQWLMPGVIDDQVHFREPGLTHKAEIYTEAKAAVAGGVTSYMEMPNVNPQTVTQELLQAKYDIGADRSLANYSFFMGTTNDNYDEVMRTNPKEVCGVKIFMGSSTGNMLVDDENTLSKIFANCPTLIATHCEDEATILANLDEYKGKYGEDIPFESHPKIRNAEACYLSSSFAVELAKKHDTRLHILHISTEKETSLFASGPIPGKRITSEACIHHLWFTDEDYKEKQQWIKWNPAVKSKADREGVWKALLNDQIDVIATDHAPHTLQEKQNKYLSAPSGGPLIQHSLVAMLDFYHEGRLSLERVVEKMCHAPAQCFEIKDRGYIREGYYADLVLVNPNKSLTVQRDNLLYKCGWSPFEGHTFKSSIDKVFVSGHLAFDNGVFDENKMGERLTFDRQ